MADVNTMTAYRAIVDNQGKPLPEFMQMWQRLVDLVGDVALDTAFHAFATNQQGVNFAAVYTAGLANTRVNALIEAGGGTVRSGLGVQWVTTTGATWVNGGSEALATVSAGDLFIYATGPLMAANVDGESSGEFRIVENGATTVFTGLWSANGDGATWAIGQNDSIEDTMTFSDALATTGSVTYDLEYRVLSGADVDLLSYLYVERS